MLALRNCYHGMSEGTMGVTAHSTWKFPVPQARTPSVPLVHISAFLRQLHRSDAREVPCSVFPV